MNKLEYLLGCLAEEGGEIVQAACKANRFGLYDKHPKRGDTTNEQDIVAEFND